MGGWYTDDTQSIIVSDNRENLLETAAIEANSAINFFNSNGLVNNADKAAVLYNSNGISWTSNNLLALDTISYRILRRFSLSHLKYTQ